MHFPGNVVKKMFPRLVGLGAIVILMGGALIVFQEFARAGMKLQQPMLAGLICIGIGVIFITIAVMALILQGTWEFKEIKILSKTARKEIRLNQNSPEMAGLDMDVDQEEAGNKEYKASTRFQRGDTLDIKLRLKSLKSMEILKAKCTLLVEKRSKTDWDRLKTIYKNPVEDIINSGRTIRQNQTVTYRFEQQLPGEQEVSSDIFMWILRLEIKAKRAADFLQDIPLNIKA